MMSQSTLFTTIYQILSNYKTKKHVYLVQNYETDFYSYGGYFRTFFEKTYSINKFFNEIPK